MSDRRFGMRRGVRWQHMRQRPICFSARAEILGRLNLGRRQIPGEKGREAGGGWRAGNTCPGILIGGEAWHVDVHDFFLDDLHASHSHNRSVLLLTLALLRPITASQPQDATTAHHKSLPSISESLAVYVASLHVGRGIVNSCDCTRLSDCCPQPCRRRASLRGRSR